MALQWIPSLAVGVTEIDRQHQELFRRVNHLYTAIHQGKGRSEVGKVIAFLEDYIHSHFDSEEKHMSRHGYPDFPAHKKLHEAFKEDFSRFKASLDARGVTSSLVIQVNRRVSDWLVDHIGKVDRAFGEFLAAKR